MTDLVCFFFHNFSRSVDRSRFSVFLRSFLVFSVKFLDSIVDQLLVLLQIQFFIIRNWRNNSLFADSLFFRVAELREIRMSESLLSCYPLIGVKLQHFAEQVKGFSWGVTLKPLSKGFWLGNGE